MPTKQEKGKGGNFNTDRNPFQGKKVPDGLRADYTEIPHLGKALQVLVEAGCACILGATRDGGAMVVTILDGESRHRTYCSTANELGEAFERIIEMYGED